jgi:hypothetical protein
MRRSGRKLGVRIKGSKDDLQDVGNKFYKGGGASGQASTLNNRLSILISKSSRRASRISTIHEATEDEGTKSIFGRKVPRRSKFFKINTSDSKLVEDSSSNTDHVVFNTSTLTSEDGSKTFHRLKPKKHSLRPKGILKNPRRSLRKTLALPP